MEDIKVAPFKTSSNFPYNPAEQSLGTAGDQMHHNEHAKRNGSSIRREIFDHTENRDGDIWGGNLY